MNDTIGIKLPSGNNVTLSTKVYNEYLLGFNDIQFDLFNNCMNGAQYFPQIIQFIVVMYSVYMGYTSFTDVLLVSLITGGFGCILWHILKLYKIPLLPFVSCLIGQTVFRLFLHFIAIAIVALAVVEDWKIILFCAIAGLITQVYYNIYIK